MPLAGNFYETITEAKKRKKKLRDFSTTEVYDDDMEKYQSNNLVLEEIKKVIDLLRNREDATMVSNYKAHKLEGNLKTYSSLALYPGSYGDKDIIILYKIHRDDHVVFYKIGNHEYVYEKDDV